MNPRHSKRWAPWATVGLLFLAGFPGQAAERSAFRGPVGEKQAAPTWGTPWSLGLLYPGVVARATLGHWAFEGVHEQNNNARAIGPRLHYLFNPGRRTVFGVGAAYAWVKGETDLQKYTGRALTGLVGMEAFSTRRLSVGMEMGLGRVALDGTDGRAADQTNLVTNVSVRWYL